ncbi:agmatinase family protein [Halomicroarcula limicola]|uniref:Agmatinase family protein n=1 Tax=Haloarcula limicola TaxID=1429915 RepID=A0A8J7YEB2_9EURY|nr:agmatinase family protein [Halomicroarcula limicola]MBV0926329.1 agmatinase family protein [Halomicroarcula limicola]
MTDDSTERSDARAFREATTGTNVELPYAGIKTFMKADIRDIEDVSGVDAAVLGAPFDGTVSNRPGARYGPHGIRVASSWLAYLSGYKGGLTNMYSGDQVDYSSLSLADCGDVPVFPTDATKTADSIEAHVATLAEQTFPVFLGGDHHCTYPAFRGFARGADLDSVGLVQIDAHTDTTARSDLFGEEYHGSVTHHIANSEFSSYEHISQVGIRGYEAPDFFDFAEDVGLSVFSTADVHERGVRAVLDDAIDAAATETDAVYVTFDIDSVDPSVAPGTGTPEPGGLSAHQALTVMQRLGDVNEVRMVDLMEVAPHYDPADNTQQLAAYLLAAFLERRF